MKLARKLFCINRTMKAEPTIRVKCIYNVRNAEYIIEREYGDKEE